MFKLRIVLEVASRGPPKWGSFTAFPEVSFEQGSLAFAAGLFHDQVAHNSKFNFQSRI